jgi:hypothetical protein
MRPNRLSTYHPQISARVACLASLAVTIMFSTRETLEEIQSLCFSTPDRYAWK